MERVPERWPEAVAFFPWQMVLVNKLDGARFCLDLRSARHAKRFCDAVLPHYVPEVRFGGQERL
ncbi:MAG: hypothetical protein FGM22_08265 [Burkholderiaceae bacterium]|nr:hypothetical protein [Burkholderiaceae bacterium]